MLKIFTLVVLSAVAALAADATAGKAVYDKSCKSCHGPDGTANPSIAKMMKVDIKNLSSAEVQAEGGAGIKTVITSGKGKMKPVTSVSGADLDNVVAYVLTLKK